MKKGTKSLGGFIVVTLSAILIIAAIIAAAFYSEVVIPEPETQALAAGEEYAHGSDIGRRPSGTAGTDYYNVSTYSDFRTRVNNNQNINLTSDITFEKGSLRSTASYTGTIYGNGHTITFDFSAFSSSTNDQGTTYAGFLAGQLDGNIYDLKIVITGGTFKSGYHGIENSEAAFGLVGYARAGSVIDNINITVNTGSGVIAYTTDNSNHIDLGLVAGVAQSCTINNITVTNNGFIAAGYSDNSNGTGDISYRDWQGTFDEHSKVRSASHIVGGYYSGTVTLNNIMIYGTGEVRGRESTNLGTTWSGGSTVNVSNFLNHFVGQFRLPRELDNDSGANPGTSASGFAKWESSASTTINTYFEYYDSDSATVSAKGAYNATISEKLSFRTTGVYANMQILFDPSTSNYNNSLVVLYTNQTTPGGVIRLWSLGSNDNGRTFSGTEENGTVIFADLPVQSIWNNNDWGTGTYSRGDGYFEATLSYTDLTQEDDLTEYEHGYVSADTPTSGTPINSGTEFENIFASNEAYGDPTKNYYLADDIIITGFTGYGSNNGFSGTLDGKGHTIYIHAARTGLDAENIGGLMGKINGGTVKNLRVALVNDLNISTSASNKTNTALGIGMITGWLTGNGLIENCNVVIKEGVTVYGAADNQDCTVAGVAGVMTGRGRVFNTTVQLDGTLKVKRSYPFIAGFVGLSEKPNFESDSVNTIPFEFKNIVFKGNGSFAGIAENTGGENVNLAAVTITPNVTQNVGQWIDMDGVIYDFSEDYWNEAASSNDIPSGYGLISQNFASDNPGGLKPTTINGTKYIDYKNLYRATKYAPVKTPAAGDSGNTAYNIPINNTIEVTVSSAAGGTISNISVTPYFRPGSDGNITLVASGTGVSGFNGVLKEKGATIGEGKDSIPAAAKDGDNLVLEMPKADVVSESDTSVGLEEAKTVTLTTDTNKSFTYSGSKQARKVYLRYGESSISDSDYTVTYAAESGSELSNGSPVNAGSYYISVVALNENAGDYYFFDAASNTLSKRYTYASADEKSNKFVIMPAEVNLAFSGSMTATYDAEAVENPEVIVSGGTFVLDDLGKLTYVWMNADGNETLSENPTNAGRYKVKISAVANPNFTVGGAAASGNDFTIIPATVELSVEGDNTFAFAQDTGALTDGNYEDIRRYSFSVTDFVKGDEVNSGYTVSITTTEEGGPSFIKENTTDGTTGTSYLSAGVYIATVVLSSENYTFGEGKNTFTVTVNENSSANKWLTEPESIISDLTYYSEPDIPTDNELPVPRFGNASVAYKNAGNSEVTPSKTLDVGTYSAVVTVSDSDSDSPSFNSLEKSYSFKVNPLTLTSVTLSGTGTTYDTAAYEESNISIALLADSVEYNSDEDIENLLGTVTWECRATESGEWSDGLPTKAEKYTFRIKSYSNSSNVIYESLSHSSGTFEISRKAIGFAVVKAGDAKLVYGTEPEDKTALVSVTPTVEDVYKEDFTKEDWSYEVELLLADGAYADTPAGTEVTLSVTVTINDGNYSLGTVSSSEPLTLVIQKADIGDITIATEFTTEREEEDGSVTPGFVYGAVTAPLTFNGIPKDVDPTIVYTKDGANIGEFTDAAEAGDYIVKVTINDKNYNEKEVSFKFFIDKAEQQLVRVTMEGWVYDGTAKKQPQIEGIKENAPYTVSYSGKTNADTNNSYGPTKDVPTAAGTYTVTVSWGKTDNYKAGEAAPVSFTIERAEGKADITITYSVGDVTDATYIPGETMLYYNGSEYTFKVAVEYFKEDGGKLTTEINGNPGDNLTTKNAGTYTVTATVTESPNYLEASSETSIVINKAVISRVSVGTSSFVFGAEGGLTTDNANDGTTYGTADVTFVEGKGGGTPAFTYSLAYNKTENDNNDNDEDKKYYIVFGEYNLSLTLTGGNFVFDGGDTATTVKVQVTQGENTWTSEGKIADYVFGFEGTEVIRTAKFGTVAVTYYREGEAIKFSDAAQGVPAGTYTAVVSVSGNDNYVGISYEYTFVVDKHDLNITNLEIFGTGVSGSAADGFTVTYAPDMGLSATVDVSSGENGFSATLDGLIGDADSHKYSFEYSADPADPKAWKEGLPQKAGIYTVRFKGMELDAKYNINNFKYNQPEVGLTISKSEIKVKATLSDDVRYGMTVAEIKERVSVSEGVSMKDVAVTYVNESGESVGYSDTTPAKTALKITVTVEAKDDNYTVDSATVELTATVQKAKLTVTAEGGSAHSATFDPEGFKAFEQVEAKWGENPVEASEYLLIELTGYSGEVAGDAETNFRNGEIGVYTFTVKLTKDDAKNFLMVDRDGAEYEGELTFTYTLATEKVTLTVELAGWTYGDAPKNPTFTVKDANGNSIGMQIIGQHISVKYEGINGTVYDSDTAPTKAGDYKITAAITEHHDYVADKEATAEFTVGKRPIALVLSSVSASAHYDRSVAITDFTSAFGDREYFSVAEGYSYADGHALKDVFTLTASSDSVVVTEIKNAGSYKITAELRNDNYDWATGATSPEFTYTIEKASLAFVVAIDDGVYGETRTPYISQLTLNGTETFDAEDIAAWSDTNEPELYAVLKGIGFTYSGWANDGSEVDGSSFYPKSAGNYTVTADHAAAGNYSAAVDDAEFVVARADQSVEEVSIEGWIYGEEASDYEIVGIKESAVTSAFYSGTTNAGTEYYERILFRHDQRRNRI